MNISNETSAHQIRIILTRTVHGIDKVTQFNSLVLNNLLNVSEKLVKVLIIEKGCVSTLEMKELIDVDIFTLRENMETIKSAIKLNKFEFEYEFNMN